MNKQTYSDIIQNNKKYFWDFFFMKESEYFSMRPKAIDFYDEIAMCCKCKHAEDE